MFLGIQEPPPIAIEPVMSLLLFYSIMFVVSNVFVKADRKHSQLRCLLDKLVLNKMFLNFEFIFFNWWERYTKCTQNDKINWLNKLMPVCLKVKYVGTKEK